MEFITDKIEYMEPYYVFRLLWIIFGFGILGWFCKWLDAPRKEVRVQHMYAAAITMLLSILVTDLLFQGSGGTFEGLKRLVAEGDISEDAWKEANFINVLLFGYMTQDMIARTIHWDFDFGYFVHHVACMIALGQHIWFGQTPIFCVVLAFGEFSTPVVCILEIAQNENLTKLLTFSGLLLNVLFPFRVLWFAWAHYVWTFEHDITKYPANHHVTMYYIGWVCSFILLLLNVKWQIELITKTIGALFASPAKDVKKD